MRALLLVLALAAAGHNSIKTYVHPKISSAGPGDCSPVTMVIDLIGPETEEWYCPEVIWELPDGTVSKFQEDCAPFEQREGYPRFWSLGRCVAGGNEGPIKVIAKLKKGNKLLRDEIEFYVK